MSKELNVLLQRIRPPVEEPAAPKEPSRDLLRLVTRTQNRRWLENELEVTETRFQEDLTEVKWIKYVLHDPAAEMQLRMIQMDIERYMGRRSPWYLNVEDEGSLTDEDWEGLPEYFGDCPRVQNYKIGWYDWNSPTGGTSEDTIRFIMDRLAWAYKNLRKELRIVANYLRALKKWDLESELPLPSMFYYY